MTRTKRRKLKALLRIGIIFMVTFGALLIFVKIMEVDESKHEENLHLERFEEIDSNFAYAVFTTPEGKEVKYTIHNYFEDIVLLDRDYDIEYVPRSTNLFRPSNEIKRMDRTIPKMRDKS